MAHSRYLSRVFAEVSWGLPHPSSSSPDNMLEAISTKRSWGRWARKAHPLTNPFTPVGLPMGYPRAKCIHFTYLTSLMKSLSSPNRPLRFPSTPHICCVPPVHKSESDHYFHYSNSCKRQGSACKAGVTFQTGIWASGTSDLSKVTPTKRQDYYLTSASKPPVKQIEPTVQAV